MQLELEKIRQARGSLENVRQKLLQPSVQALECAAADVARAVECLQRVESCLKLGGRRRGGAEQAIRAQIDGLRSDLRRVNALLEGAGKFYQGWARLMSSGAEDAVMNYTAEGKTGRAAAATRLVLHG
ncbi:MAG TPA: hypothetical protein VEU96_22455 [Bryobacteraceae bacterium]|nr:hypothetical protein [Bryobacteraceae bacterium]